MYPISPAIASLPILRKLDKKRWWRSTTPVIFHDQSSWMLDTAMGENALVKKRERMGGKDLDHKQLEMTPPKPQSLNSTVSSWVPSPPMRI